MSQRVVLPWRETLAVWTERSVTKFNTEKCQVLYLEPFEGKPLHQYRLELGKQFSREDLEMEIAVPWIFFVPPVFIFRVYKPAPLSTDA